MGEARVDLSKNKYGRFAYSANGAGDGGLGFYRQLLYYRLIEKWVSGQGELAVDGQD